MNRKNGIQGHEKVINDTFFCKMSDTCDESDLPDEILEEAQIDSFTLSFTISLVGCNSGTTQGWL